MKRKAFDVVLTLLGLLLAGLGLFLVKALQAPQGALLTLPYVCIGVGCGLFGHGMGNAVSRRAVKAHPELQKQMEIDQNDERNTAISGRAKAKAFDLMIYVFGALMLSFALMGVDMMAILLLVFSYLMVVGSGIYYRFRYEKEM